MSVINKKPYIASVIEALSEDELASLKDLINGGQDVADFYSLINDDYSINEVEDEVSLVNLETKEGVFTGYLIWKSGLKVLLSFEATDKQSMKILQIDATNKTYSLVEQKLSINELRGYLAEGSGSSGGTKLYKHTLTVPISYNDEDFNATCIVISTSNQSFKNKLGSALYALGYVSALIQTEPDGAFYPVALFTYESEPHILFVSDYSSVESITCNNRFTDDVITEL